MSNELPNLGADVVLEFQQSLNNIRLFGEALEGLDTRFGNMENRINSMKSSLSSLSAQTSRGTGRNLRAEIERELNNLIQGNGVVLSQVGTAAFRVDANTIRNVFNRVESEINQRLAQAYQNIVIQVDPSLQVGRVPISRDDFEEVNRAIARLVRVQLNNLVSALRRHGAGMISAQDLAAVQFHIGRGTIQQIIERIKSNIQNILLNPQIAPNAQFNITERDLNRIFLAIRDRVRDAITNAVGAINTSNTTVNLAPNMDRIFDAVNNSARDYIRDVANGINSIGQTAMTRPVNQLTQQLRRFMANELGTDLATFNQMFANHRFTNADVHSAELRRQFARLESALNRRISGGLQGEVRSIIQQIQGVQISYSPRLRYHLVNEINRINNQIVRKIREQIDIQFANMRAEIDSVQVAPRDINRARRVRDMGRVHYDDEGGGRRGGERRELANDPYARRDQHFNGFGLEGAIVNTFRHILAGSIVGAPMMMMYQSIESFKTSQLEQLKMYSNLVSRASATSEERARQGDTRSPGEYAAQTIKEVMPFVQNASQFFAVDYGQMSQVASIGTRLLDTTAEVKRFTDIVGKIYNIDREGNPVESIAPGLEAFMGQFDLAVGELESRVVLPMDAATNLTNATTEGVMKAIQRSGSSFKAAGVTPEQAIAMVASSIKFTGLSGENIGNFYKSILPRLQSQGSLKELEKIGVEVYQKGDDGITRALPASEVLKNVSERYVELEDPQALDVIMKLFGTYQSSKGMTTLDEFNEYVKIMKEIDKSQKDPSQFIEKMMANTMSPILEIQRAEVAANLALTSVIEELSPEIVKVAQGITNLAQGIREHKDALAGFISFLGNALMGLAVWQGGRWLGNRAGVPGAIERVQAVDSVMGNRGVFGRGATQGVIANFAGIGNVAPQAVGDNNRAFVNRAMSDPALAPFIRQMSEMTDAQVRSTQAYIQDNNLRVRDMRELMLVMQEAQGYEPRRQLTPDERWGGSMQAAGRLHRNGMMGLDANFAQQLAGELQNRQRFDQLSQTRQGRRVTNFLAGLDENEMRRFQAHLEELHRQTGRTVNDMGSLTHAINTYAGAQAQSREEARRTNPHLVELGNNIDRVANSMNSQGLTSGLRNFDDFLGGLGQRTRGVAAAIGGLARTVAGFGAQMLLFAGIGELVGSLGSEGLYTDEQKAVQKNEKLVQDINELKERTRMSGFAQSSQLLWDSLMSIWDGVTSPTKDKYSDITDIKPVADDMAKFLNETRGANLDTSGARGDYIISDITDYINSEGLDRDKLFDEFMNWGDNSVKDNLKKARVAEYTKRYEEMALEEQEQKALEERLRGKVDERRRKELSEGNYRIYDLDSVKQNLSDQVKDFQQQAALDQLKKLSEGYTSDSEEFVAARSAQTKKIVDLYKAELKMIDDFITQLEESIVTMRKEGADPEEIKKEEELLAQWKKNKGDAEKEFGVAAAQAQAEQDQMAYDAAMSRINRSVQKADSALAAKDAINSATMDRSSKDYIDASIGSANERMNNLRTQMEQLRGAAITPDQQAEVETQIAQLQAQLEQEKVRIRDLKLSSIGLYKQDLQDSLAQMSNDYLQAKVDSGITDDNSPFLKNLRVEQYEKQVGMFDSLISDLQGKLKGTTDPEAVKNIQREIRDLQRQSLQAQLGILDEMKNTGGTFNLPDNVKAMSYYEYITRNNTHSTYTVQGGDTHVTVTLPNITDGTSAERIRQIGKAIGEGMGEGRNLRLQKQANPFGYRG